MKLIRCKYKHYGFGYFEFRSKCPYKQKDIDGDTMRVGNPDTCGKCIFYNGIATNSKTYVICSFNEKI